ncbi:hypothetical protein HBJ00_14415 [Aeromonas veronii]|uniref:hypothetical protein n=1 Tax=Aeromonas TaxID=642 RepID=UPI001431608A|nr:MULTISPECIES: hypothetical protein [Aeromonas]EKP0313576.1 hypothetical protein [Aeromonas veronii]NJI19867.1 hypothetical protein [Aeromonas veronii]BBT81178.1 hypothetical protein WP8S18E11_28440 [Aeromonas veronii]
MELAGMRPFLLEVIGTLLMGGVVIVLIEINRRAGREWSWGQRLVLVCTLLFICGRGYWVMHPSSDEVQLLQPELNEYGL